jgi:hypothetical protein
MEKHGGDWLKKYDDGRQDDPRRKRAGRISE